MNDQKAGPQKAEPETAGSPSGAEVEQELLLGARMDLLPTAEICGVSAQALGEAAAETRENAAGEALVAVRQDLRLELLLRLGSEAAAGPAGFLPLPRAEPARPLWYYRIHSERTARLIEDAGGSLPLGGTSACGLTATAENAGAILSFGAGARELGKFPAALRILYAQQLAAALNRLEGRQAPGGAGLPPLPAWEELSEEEACRLFGLLVPAPCRAGEPV